MFLKRRGGAVFQTADYGLVANLYVALPELAEKLGSG
jgi:electron transfer flavoprotein alpha subunit